MLQPIQDVLLDHLRYAPIYQHVHEILRQHGLDPYVAIHLRVSPCADRRPAKMQLAHCGGRGCRITMIHMMACSIAGMVYFVSPVIFIFLEILVEEWILNRWLPSTWWKCLQLWTKVKPGTTHGRGLEDAQAIAYGDEVNLVSNTYIASPVRHRALAVLLLANIRPGTLTRHTHKYGKNARKQGF
jgi:hypothetical protein